MKIINNLDRLIKESEFKTKYIYSELDINRGTLSSWRNNKTYPSVVQTLQLAKLFNCKVEDIYRISDE